MFKKLLAKNPYQLLATAAFVDLFILCVCWEWFISPLRPGGSWLILKGIPLTLCNSRSLERQGLHHAMGFHVNPPLYHRGFSTHSGDWYQFLDSAIGDHHSYNWLYLFANLSQAH
jgi:hypothetical protein